MSRVARDWAWSCRGLTPALRCILLALAEHADEEGRCWPSLTRLAALTEVDRRTVTRGLAELEVRGLVARERILRQSTTYALAIGEPDGCETRLHRACETPSGVTPLHQGCETPGGVTPLGATDPQSRGVTPMGRGMTPPDLGVSHPPNRHKNRHITVSEPSLSSAAGVHPPKCMANGRGKAGPVPPDWRPGERVFDWAAKQGMARQWVEAQIDEFVVYWSDTGERRKSWEATFINRLRTLQANEAKRQDHEPQQRLADKDYGNGATPLDQIPWIRPAIVG
ncbi:MAG: helix-turn-helix domain-containing protein [Rhodobacteraceae bacterium]|nr:helix-turn-helix domain-containing protein [Paracoccaceae bacterium]